MWQKHDINNMFNWKSQESGLLKVFLIKAGSLVAFPGMI